MSGVQAYNLHTNIATEGSYYSILSQFDQDPILVKTNPLPNVLP